MDQLIAFTTDDGTRILIEPAGPRSGPVDVSRASSVKQAGEHFNQVLDQVRQVAQAVGGKLGDLPRRPDEVTVELGIGIAASANAFIAQSTANAALKVTLTWKASGPQE